MSYLRQSKLKTNFTQNLWKNIIFLQLGLDLAGSDKINPRNLYTIFSYSLLCSFYRIAILLLVLVVSRISIQKRILHKIRFISNFMKALKIKLFLHHFRYLSGIKSIAISHQRRIMKLFYYITGEGTTERRFQKQLQSNDLTCQCQCNVSKSMLWCNA